LGDNTIGRIPENLECGTLLIDGFNTISRIPENFECNKLEILGKNLNLKNY
jgi:hypothetical protein